MKHWKLHIIDCWVIRAVYLTEKGVEWFQENIDLTYIYQLTKSGGLMSCGSKDLLKNAPSHVRVVIMTSQIW